MKLIDAVGFQAPHGIEEVKPLIVAPGQERIELLVGGSVYFLENGVETLSHAGAMFWHVSGDETIHRYPAQSPYDCLLVVFEHDTAPSRLVPRHTQWRDVPAAQAFAREVLDARLAGQLAVPAFCAYVYQRLLWNAVAGSTSNGKSSLSAHLSEACEFIRRNIDADLAVENIARTIGISSTHLHYLFREHFGRTPHGFILEERFHKACKLLRGSRLQSKEIAHACGFRDAAEFSRTFRRLAGCTPGEYRSSRSSGDQSLPTGGSADDRFSSPA